MHHKNSLQIADIDNEFFERLSRQGNASAAKPSPETLLGTPKLSGKPVMAVQLVMA